MRTQPRLLLLFALSLLALSNVEAAQTAPSQQARYDALIDRVKRNDASVDVCELRLLATTLPGYSSTLPVGGFDQLNYDLMAEDPIRALKLADERLNSNYLSIKAHIIAGTIRSMLSEEGAAAHHKFVVTGILDSIKRGADGHFSSSAFRVISPEEECVVLASLGLQWEETIVEHDDGHTFHVVRSMDPSTGKKQNVYFNIDPIWKARNTPTPSRAPN